MQRFAKWQARLSLGIAPGRSVSLGHQRIFIVPSATGVIYWIALVIMLLAAINYQNSLAYGLTFWLGAMSLLAMLHTWRNLAGLNVALGQSALVQAGSHAHVQLSLSAHVRAHYGLELHLGPQSQRLDLAQGAVLVQAFEVQADARGWLTAPRLKIQTLYPLGLFRAWSWIRLEHAVLAYPSPQEGPLPMFRSEGANASNAPSTRQQGLDDFQGIRAYQPGDSLSRIHWKSLSKGLGLHSKTFAAEHFDSQCLDLASAPGDLESRLSLLSFWVLAFTQANRPFTLKLGHTCLGPDSGQAHAHSCLTALALYGSDPCSP